MSHFADGSWHPLVGTYASGSVTGITFAFNQTASRGTFTTPTIENGWSISNDTTKSIYRPYRIYGIIMTTTVGTKGSGSDQKVKLQAVFTNPNLGTTETNIGTEATVSSSTATSNTVRFELVTWIAPGATVTIQSKTSAGSLGTGAAATYRIDYTVEAM
jgi:hypothetical protein